MGTTIIAAMFYDNKVAIGLIGDSRVYQFRDDKLTQVTKDQSLVQELSKSAQTLVWLQGIW
jgi:serine/threonine protein phosphatase PrpC